MANKSVFKLETIHKVGQLAADFDDFIKASVHDCKERPAMAKPREVRLTVRLEPDKNDPADVIVRSQVTSKIPAREASPYKMQTTVNDGLKLRPAHRSTRTRASYSRSSNRKDSPCPPSY